MENMQTMKTGLNPEARGLTPGDAALVAKCSKKTILRAIKRGDLPVNRLNARVFRIDREAVNRWAFGKGI